MTRRRTAVWLIAGLAITACIPATVTFARTTPRGPLRGCGSEADQIAYVGNKSSNLDVWTMRADGSANKQLTNNPAADVDPMWSPDGRRIAFASMRGGSWDIWTMDADGSDQRNLTRTPAVTEAQPTWSPDGRWIAFHSVSSDDVAVEDAEIKKISSKGHGPIINLTNTPLVKEVKPHWSPDGTLIAYEGNGGPGALLPTADDNIWVMDADGSDMRQVTQHPHREWFPAWSPDSSQLAYMSLRDGNWEIYVIGADGSGERRLTTDPETDGRPSWSPDGRRIAYDHLNDLILPIPLLAVTLRDPTEGVIRIVPVDGSGDPTVIDEDLLIAAPAYRPC